jgi:hypothetical protein
MKGTKGLWGAVCFNAYLGHRPDIVQGVQVGASLGGTVPELQRKAAAVKIFIL